MGWVIAIVVVVWLAIALSSGRSPSSDVVKASYTGEVAAFGTFQSYGTWGATNHTYMTIRTKDHTEGLTEVRVIGSWTRRTFKTGDQVVKHAGEHRPHIRPAD